MVLPVQFWQVKVIGIAHRSLLSFSVLRVGSPALVLGSDMSESYSERGFSAANIIMTPRRTRMKSKMLECLTVLRMNREFMEFVRETYPTMARETSEFCDSRLAAEAARRDEDEYEDDDEGAAFNLYDESDPSSSL